ncbi:MAG: hypothetical protein EBT30_08870, partial [Verrucomicrobia bacterium]|nr:hypothetical protein [Verrucomicrobiota bacterium]
MFGAGVTTKVYDGTTAAVVTGAVLLGNSTAASDGKFIGSETVTLSGGTSGTFADKNVGTGKGVTTAMTLGGADAGNYTLLNQPTLRGDITAKDLNVFGAGVTTKVYDGTTAAVVTGAVLVGNSSSDTDGKFIGAETVTLSGATSGTFASKNVGTGKGVTTTMTLGGADAGNYTLLNQPVLTGTITAKALTISVATPSTVVSKVYNGNRTATVNVGALAGLVSGEALGATGVVGTFAGKNIGTKNVTAVYTLTDGVNPLYLASNYTLAGETLTGTITAKDLSVFSAAVTTKVYDGSDSAVVTGAVLVGNSTADNDGKYIGTETVTLSGGTSGTFASKNVGTGKGVTTAMTLGGADAGNYTLSTQPTLTGTITAKNITMSGTVLDKVYDGNTAATIVLGSLTGLVGAEQLQVSVAGNAGTFSDKNVGGSTIPVTVTYTLADDLASGGVVSNYNLVNQTDTISGRILAKDLQVFNAVVTTKVYDGTTDAVITGAGLIGNSSSATDGKYVGTETLVLGSSTTGTFASKNVGAGQTVTTAMTLGGVDVGNYTLNTQPTLTGAITAKGLDVVVGEVTVTKVYDGTTAIANGNVSIDATTFALRNGAATANDGKFYSGEDVKLKLNTAGALTSKDASVGLQNVTTQVELDGAAVGNYALNAYQLKGTVTRKDLVV